ncbi:hypothetical protein HK096_005162 [Nowakowskiella sp. JEL0078]|nr:hypothetical protein HK096_005162 [Nowakowskiella sp. JEL0078]
MVHHVATRFAPVVERLSIKEGNSSYKSSEVIHDLTGVTKARNLLGLTGKGIKVAVIDSGVYYKHPALGGGFGPGFKINFGTDLVGDNYGSTNKTLAPDDDPIDNCSSESHGTHVAGIIAADSRNIVDSMFQPIITFTGAAPDVNIGAYRIFGCIGDNVETDIITAAIYLAANDGAHIINISLGGGPRYSDESDAVAAQRVGEAGHIVLASNGNDGDAGAMTVGAPADSLGGLGIASFDNSEVYNPYFTLNGVIFQYQTGSLNSSFPNNQTLDLFVNSPNAIVNRINNDGCANVSTDATGKLVVLYWGIGCGSKKRCDNAANAGAMGCLIISNGPSLIDITGSALIPSGSTTNEAGLTILKEPGAIFTIFKTQRLFSILTKGTVSDFSSSGLGNELHIKPDIGGIGGKVYSTISPFAAKLLGESTSYAYLSGTSMSSPNVAGALALLLQAHKGISFKTARAYLLNNAIPTKIFGTNLIDSVTRQGSGLVNIYNSITSKTLVTPPLLALNDSQFTLPQYKICVQNLHNTTVFYTLSNVPAATANIFVSGNQIIQPAVSTNYTADYAELEFGSSRTPTLTIQVSAGSSKFVSIKFYPPNIDRNLYPIFSGFISISNNVNNAIITVPYSGMIGKWQTAPILSTSDSFPTPTGFYDDKNESLSSNMRFNLTLSSVQVVSALATTTRLLYVEAIYFGSDKNTTKFLKNAGLCSYSKCNAGLLSFVDNNRTSTGILYGVGQRNTPIISQSVLTPAVKFWIGDIASNSSTQITFKLPPGKYKLRILGLKHFVTLKPNLKDESFDVIFKILFLKT